MTILRSFSVCICFPVWPMLYRIHISYRRESIVSFLFTPMWAFGDACSLVNSRTSLTLSFFNQTATRRLVVHRRKSYEY